MQNIMKEENLHESLVLRLTAVASMLSLAYVKDSVVEQHHRWLMKTAVPPPRLLLLHARSVRKHWKPGGVMSVLSISEVSQLSVTAMALRLEYILDIHHQSFP